MGPPTSSASLVTLFWLFAMVVCTLSLPRVKPYSGQGDECRCLPYSHVCSLEVFPLTIVSAYSFAPYTCWIGTRLCCIKTQEQLEQLEHKDPLSEVNAASLLVRDPSSHLYRARQLRYDPGSWIKNDEPAATADEGIQLKEDWYKDENGTGNMMEDTEEWDFQEEVEVQYMDMRKEEESVDDTEKPTLEQNYELGNDLVVMENNAFQAVTETDETSQVATEGESKSYVTVKEMFHMTEEGDIAHKAVKKRVASQADTGGDDASQVAEDDDTSQTLAERETAFHSPVTGEEKYKLSVEENDGSKVVMEEEKSRTAIDNVHTTQATTEKDIRSHEAKDNPTMTLTTVDPISTMQSFHDELRKGNLGAALLSMEKGNDTILHMFTTTESLSQKHNTSKPTELPHESTSNTVNINISDVHEVYDGSHLVVEVNDVESNSQPSFSEEYNLFTSTPSNIHALLMLPEATGDKSATQIIYNSNSTLDPPKMNIRESMDYANIATELINLKNKKLAEFPYSVPATEPEQLATIIHDVTDEAEKTTEKYHSLHKHPSTEDLDIIYSAPVTKLSMKKVKNTLLDHEKSHDPIFETKQVVLSNQFSHSNNCSYNNCGNNSLATDEPSIIIPPTKDPPFLVTVNYVTRLPSSSTPVRLSSTSPTEHPETLSLPRDNKNISSEEFLEPLQESSVYTATAESTGLDTTPPATSDVPVLWYWFLG